MYLMIQVWHGYINSHWLEVGRIIILLMEKVFK